MRTSTRCAPQIGQTFYQAPHRPLRVQWACTMLPREHEHALVDTKNLANIPGGNMTRTVHFLVWRACCCESPLSQMVRPRKRASRLQGENVRSDVLFSPSHRSCSSRCAAIGNTHYKECGISEMHSLCLKMVRSGPATDDAARADGARHAC